MDVGNLIRNIVREVSRECKNYKINADPKFLTYYVQLLNLDPNRGISEDVMAVRRNIQAFIKFVVLQLQQQTQNPKLVTLKLQHTLDDSLKNIPDAIVKYKREQERKLATLYLAIAEPEYRPDPKILYTRLAQYIVLVSHMGSLNSERVFKETHQALQSVLNLDEVTAFPSLHNFTRREVLDSIVKVTTGVKIFNKYCNKGGAEIPDLPVMLSNAIESVKEAVDALIGYNVLRCEALTKVLQKFMDKKCIPEDELVWEIKKGMDEREFPYVRDLLVANKELLNSLRVVLEEIEKLEEKTNQLRSEYAEILSTLKEIVTPSMHQSVLQLFPLFTYLCDIWMEFQDAIIKLQELKQLANKQCALLKPLNMERAFQNQYIDLTLKSNTSITEKTSEKAYSREFEIEDFPSKIVESKIIERNGVHVIYDERMKSYIEAQDTIMYCGYCCWVLVQSAGGLLLGNRDYGIVRFKGKYFLFSDVSAANAFTREPNYYVKKVIELARQNVELIHFLDIEEYLIRYKDKKTLVKTAYVKREVRNSPVQAETHISKSCIDHSYKWNIWDHRRRANKMVCLIRSKTVGTMTTKNSYQMSVATQTYDPKESDTQTKIDNYNNTFKKLSYMHGLRGRTDDKQFRVDFLPPEWGETLKNVKE